MRHLNGTFGCTFLTIGHMEFSATAGRRASSSRERILARVVSAQRVVKQREFKQWARFTVLSLALARYEYLRCIAFAFARWRRGGGGGRRPGGVGSVVDSRGKSPKGVG